MSGRGCVSCSGRSVGEGRQYGGSGSGYGGSGLGQAYGASSGLGQAYGGGYGGQGFVECCEGVVDPLILLGIIAGASRQSVLAWITCVACRRPGSAHILPATTGGIRMCNIHGRNLYQVVTFIMGRSLSSPPLLPDLGLPHSSHSSSGSDCLPELLGCMTGVLGETLQSEGQY